MVEAYAWAAISGILFAIALLALACLVTGDTKQERLEALCSVAGFLIVGWVMAMAYKETVLELLGG